MSGTQQPTNTGNGNAYQYDPYNEARVPRRTPMACQFCRARKLKCDGFRPQCSNCNRRGYHCSYVPVAEQGTR
ncbi:hypothetical protein FB45DRAFT_395093 [Roridomyces roridus]|uniref:Zn(2)-C6 fungal-type domain-containing protein n=1 Tax=Roridomyces roridus TaxID=1738132 RepID=A0AAD7B0Z8_9AGAR|nr:hypothetical protein FB45DRAFT_395093 [Roridomyces roridus]